MNDSILTRRRFLEVVTAGGLLVLEPAFAEGADQGPKLVKLINDYRKTKDLPEVPVSPKLTKVAVTHVADFNKYPPPRGTNLHSWSENGPWKGGIFDLKDKSTHSIMWDKPKEIADYQSHGFEISARSSAQLNAERALEIWKMSPGHNGCILNEGIWKDLTWQAMGAACEGSFSCVWFGTLADK